MEDPFADGGWANYARMTCPPDADDTREAHEGVPREDSTWAGLFTRPAVLAIRDEETGNVPARAMNQACNLLLRGHRTGGVPTGEGPDNRDDVDIIVDEVARACGFDEPGEFRRMFHRATGWDPREWRIRFGGV